MREGVRRCEKVREGARRCTHVGGGFSILPMSARPTSLPASICSAVVLLTACRRTHYSRWSGAADSCSDRTKRGGGGTRGICTEQAFSAWRRRGASCEHCMRGLRLVRNPCIYPLLDLRRLTDAADHATLFGMQTASTTAKSYERSIALPATISVTVCPTKPRRALRLSLKLVA